jgi:hypothetical protein
MAGLFSNQVNHVQRYNEILIEHFGGGYITMNSSTSVHAHSFILEIYNLTGS